MNLQKLTLARFGKTHFAALLASSALFTAGCSNMSTTAPDAPVSGEATFVGRVHGGNQAVSQAAVQLWAVGQGSGPGQGATLYAQTQTANDGTGSFSFVKNTSGTQSGSSGNSYSCPTSGAPFDPVLYVYSRGGNTTGTGTGIQNTAAAFLAPVGLCSQVTNATFVDVSEVTTAATVAAVGQFINPATDQIGNDAIGVAYQAIVNAFATIPNLVNAATGIANSTTTIAGSGTGVGGVTMTVTSPTTTVNTIANIISACVNQATQTSGTSCSTLFTNAIPPATVARTSQPTATFNAAQDTVEAALYMYLNPTDGSTANRTNLFNLQQAVGAPYQPTLSAMPTDWLLPITYTSSSTCGTNSTFFSHPYDMNVDINGNLWIANKAGTNAATVEISPNGLPEACVSLGSSSMGGGVIDTNGSVWTADSVGGAIYAYNPSGGAIRTFTVPTGGGSPLAIVADGTGNIFFSTVNGTTGSVYEIINAANVNNTSSPVLITNAVGPNPARMFPDSAADIWVTSGSSFVTELQFTTGQGNVHNFLPVQFNVAGPTYGIIVGPANRIFITSQDAGSTLTILQPSGNSYAIQTTSTGNIGGLNKPTGIWIDGGVNSWVGNNTAETSGLYAASEIATDGTAVSASGTNGGYQKLASAIGAARNTMVDPIGNVWIVNDNLPNSVTELLGAAVPIYAPYSAGITNGRFQSIP